MSSGLSFQNEVSNPQEYHNLVRGDYPFKSEQSQQSENRTKTIYPLGYDNTYWLDSLQNQAIDHNHFELCGLLKILKEYPNLFDGGETVVSYSVNNIVLKFSETIISISTDKDHKTSIFKRNGKRYSFTIQGSIDHLKAELKAILKLQSLPESEWTKEERLEVLRNRIRVANHPAFSEQPNDNARHLANEVIDFIASMNLLPRVEWYHSIDPSPEGGIILTFFSDTTLFRVVVFNEKDEEGCLILLTKENRNTKEFSFLQYSDLKSLISDKESYL